MTRLVLWDIDGTLMDAAGFGWRVMERAFRQVCGAPLVTSVLLSGRTDRAINLEVLAVHGRDPGELAALCQAIGALATVHSDELIAHGGRTLPGAVEAIAALAESPDVVQSVLTGNLRELGLVKLAAFGLLERLDLGVAAFGDDHEVRANLVEVAREQSGARGAMSPDIVLVGDTPLDVEAALTAGAGIVAVATGRYSVADLTAAGAPVVLPDLTDTPRVVAAIMTAT